MMQTYIEEVKRSPNEYIRERSALSRWLGFLPSIDGLESPILFKDKWMNFSNYFLCSLDFDFVMLDVLVVSFIDIVA